MLPPGSIWFTGQLIGLGYCKMLREAVCPPLRVYQGPSLLQLSNDTKPGPGINTPITSFPLMFLFTVEIGFKWQAWKYTGGTQWGSSSQAHLSLLPSLLSFIAVLGTTSYSDRHTPSTCPHRLKLVEHWDSRSSTLFLGKSMSHSKGVDYVRAEWVVRSMLAHSFRHKAMDTPRRVATWKNLFRWGTFTLPLEPLVSYEDEPFVTWHAIS